MITGLIPDVHTLPVPAPTFVCLAHNLPMNVDFWVVQFIEKVEPQTVLVVSDANLRFNLTSIVQGQRYKLIAYPIRSGFADGLYWSDNYLYDAGQVSISFTSGGNAGNSGDPGSFSGVVKIKGQGVSRQVFAVAVDADPPFLLAQTQSASNGGYTLEWQGYSGQMLVTALDDYGQPFTENQLLGVGDRVHPASPNGYVYEAANVGNTGAEPTWPTDDGDSVTSGDVQFVAVEYWRPKAAGPFAV